MKKQNKKINEINDLDSPDINFKDFFSHLKKDTQQTQPDDFDQSELEKGTEDEHEHTTDDAIAQKIATDHLKDDPHYYSNLEKCKNKENNLAAVVISTKEKNISSNKPDNITGDIDGTPINKTISSVSEGGSEITEPNAGITSDMKKDEKPTRWSINAYPNKGKITPTL